MIDEMSLGIRLKPVWITGFADLLSAPHLEKIILRECALNARHSSYPLMSPLPSSRRAFSGRFRIWALVLQLLPSFTHNLTLSPDWHRPNFICGHHARLGGEITHLSILWYLFKSFTPSAFDASVLISSVPRFPFLGQPLLYHWSPK